MNNNLLLGGLLTAVLLGGGACPAHAIDHESGRVFTLESLFETAESSSRQLRPTFSAEKVSEREISVARAGYLPEIDAALSVGYIGDGFTTDRAFSDRQKAPIPHLSNGLALTVTQPVYAGGAIKSGVEIARLRSTAARYATELQRDNIRFQLTGFYLDIFKCRNLRSVIENNIDRAKKVLVEMTERHSRGMALQNDITRYELLLANLELELIKIDNTLSILNRNLVVTAGLPDGTIIIPDSTILVRSLPQTPGETQWQNQAEANSPALNLARNQVDISRKAEKLTRSDYLPKIGIKAGWSIDGPILTEIPPINRNLSYWYAGVGISYNLSSLYKTNKSMARSKAATLQATDALEAERERLSLEVRADHIRYLEAIEELKTREKAVELASKNYSIVSTRYSADMALITDLLDAANSRLDAEQQLVNAKIDIIYNYYKLLFITGQI